MKTTVKQSPALTGNIQLTEATQTNGWICLTIAVSSTFGIEVSESLHTLTSVVMWFFGHWTTANKPDQNQKTVFTNTLTSAAAQVDSERQTLTVFFIKKIF